MALYVDDGYVDTGYIQEGISIFWSTKEIFIPKVSMLQIQTTPVEIRQLDIIDLHERLRDIEDDIDGIAYSYTHNYKASTSVSGVVLAPVVEILEPYTITFEDGLYNVNIVGGNSNISDRTNKNQVGVNTANSAGLQDLSSLQAASFGDGAVALDQINGVSGTTYPIGTKGIPSNNWTDARTIAESRNMDKITIIGNATAGVGDDISNITIVGTNPVLSSLTVSSEATTDNVYIKELFFQGTLDGGTILRDCVLGNINYFNGYIEHCALTSSTIYVNGIGVLLNCRAGATCLTPPTLDTNGATGLAIRNFDGNLKIMNKHSAGQCQIGLNGVLHIDSTVDTGSITVYGDAKIEDNSTGTFIIDDQTTGTPEEISDKVWTATTRELTSAATSSLTAEQEAQLLAASKAATFKDVVVANQI